MTSQPGIREAARVLGVRLRLDLVTLGEIERWAEQAIVGDEGAHDELVELCLARQQGERKAQALLKELGGPVMAGEVLAALQDVDVDALSPPALKRLADNLHPVLDGIDAEDPDHERLKPGIAFARAYWDAQVSDRGALPNVESDFRAFLRDLKGSAAPSTKRYVVRAPPQLKVSAIVVSFRTGNVLFDGLRALEADPDVHEIVLVDNGNDEAMRARIEAARERSTKLKVVREDNRGFAAGVNAGARAAAGDRLLIVNPDAVLEPGSIAALEAARAGISEPAVVGGRIFGADGKEQRGGRRRRLTLASAAATFLGLGWLKALHRGFVGLNLNDEPAPSGPIPVGAVSGALMYLSRAGFDRLHGFDEGYFLHVEDLDICRRAEAEGGSVVYTPLASALHHGATSDAPAIAVERYKAAGLGRYFQKFAATPAERIAAWMLGPFFTAALVGRAWMRGGRRG